MAYDTDDWVFRVATMVQMVGVLVLALGLPPVIHSIDVDTNLDNAVAVAGYVVMRAAMIFLLLRAARQDQTDGQRRPARPDPRTVEVEGPAIERWTAPRRRPTWL